MNQKQLVDAARRLVALVDDPQPGLVTWNEACGEAAEQIKEALVEGPTRTEEEALEQAYAEFRRQCPIDQRSIAVVFAQAFRMGLAAR